MVVVGTLLIRSEGLYMSKIVVTLFAACLFFLSTNLFAHEAELELPKYPSNFGSSIGINGTGDSLIILNGSTGASVYIKENNEWYLQYYTLKPESSSNKWRYKEQKLSVNGNFAAITSRPDGDVYIYRWDGIEWNLYRKATIPTEVKNISMETNGDIAIQSEINNRIYIYSSDKEKIIHSFGGSPTSNPKTINGAMDKKGEILVVSSEQTAFAKTSIYKSGKIQTRFPYESRSISIDSSEKSFVTISADGKYVNAYKYNHNIDEKMGWYEAASISADEVGISSFGKSIKIFGNKIFVASIANYDKEYGRHSEHGEILFLYLSTNSLQLRKKYINHDFTNSSTDLSIAVSSSQLFVGDKNHGKTNKPTPSEGKAYCFNLNEKNYVDLELEVSTPQNILYLGDTATYQLTVTNDSYVSATNIKLEIAYNPYLGLDDTQNNPNFEFISAISATGLCAEDELIKYRITCKISNLSPKESELVTLKLKTEYINQMEIFANTYSTETDRNYYDNFGTFDIQVSSNEVEQYVIPLEFHSYLAEITDYSSYRPQLSINGDLVTFYTNAQLTENTSESYHSIYTVNRYNSVIELTSSPTGGFNEYGTANGSSSMPKISDDGEMVVFASYASNLVKNDTNSVQDIFAHNRISKETYRISVSNTGEQSNAASSKAEISANGRFIAFHSEADNLVKNDFNNSHDIFIHDTITRTISRIETTNSDDGELTYITSPSISEDGMYLAFVARPVSASTKTLYIYMLDRYTETLKRISLIEMPDGTKLTNASAPVISDNAQFIYYVLAKNIYKYNIFTQETELITIGIDSEKGNGNSLSPSISADGRFALYSSSSSNLIENDTNSLYDIFLYDADTAETSMVNIGVGGYQAKGNSYHCAISADGTTISYSSIAHNLTLYDTNDAYDIFFVENSFTTNQLIPIDLQIVSTSPIIETSVDEEFEFNFYITNESQDPNAFISEVSVTSTIPSGILVSSVKSSNGECQIEDKSITCNIESIDPSRINETITIKANAVKQGDFSFSANVSALEEDIAPENNLSQISITAIKKIDLFVTSIEDQLQHYIGDEFTIAYVLGNMSETIANNVTIELIIPENISIISALIEGGACQIYKNSIMCIIGDISSTAETQLIIEANSVAHGNMEIFTEIYSEQNDIDTGNNKSKIQLEILPKADLTVEISTTENTIFADDAIIYQINVTNKGLSPAENSKLIDVIDNDLNIELMRTTHGSCRSIAQEVDCDIGTLNTNETATILIKTLQSLKQQNPKYAEYYNKYKHLKGKIKAFLKDLKDPSIDPAKKELKNLSNKHKYYYKNWASNYKTQEKIYANKASVSTETPEINTNNNSTSLTANISHKAFLRLIKAGRGNGTIEANNINCNTICKTTVAKSRQLTITATPELGSKFNHWAGACKGTNPVCTIDINRKYKTVAAVFK